jgi:hypothetical protein
MAGLIVCAALPGVSVFPKQPPAAISEKKNVKNHGFTGTLAGFGDGYLYLAIFSPELSHTIQ